MTLSVNEKKERWYHRNWKKELIEILIIFTVGGLFQILIWCTRCWEDANYFLINFIYSGLLWSMLSKGSQYGVDFLNRYYTWLEKPLMRLISSLALITVYTIFVFLFLQFAFDVLVFGKSFESAFIELKDTSPVIAIWITLGINTFMHGRGFLLEWRQTSVDMERLRTEQAMTQFQSLKNQVNPHFLFNSLNALSSLVYDDQEKAVEFIRRLSHVYRYVLDKKDEELVPIEDELSFMENFIFLQKIRFGDNLKTTVTNKVDGGYLPPLALQILIENAIKHNVVSEKDPLTIDVTLEDEVCTVVNSIKEKLAKDSTGIGLSNLKARYQYLSNKQVKVENNGQLFSVELPILTMEK